MSRKTQLNNMRNSLIVQDVYVFVTVAGKRRIGQVIGINDKTTWVRIMKGAKSYFTIIRKNKKHNAQLYRIRSLLNENVHSPVEDTAGSPEVLDSPPA